MTFRRWLLAASLAAVLGAVAGTPAIAYESVVRCSFGGPAGTSRIVRLDLPSGSDFLNLNLTGSRALRPTASTESWHLARGVFVVDEETHQVVSHRVSSEGSTNRRTVVDVEGGERVDLATPGPDAPFVHGDLRLAPRLPAGSYLIAAFGSDGDPALPNDGWGGFVEVSGGTCTSIGGGTLLDVNHADFTGGTQVSTFGTAYIDGSTFAHEFARDLVVGFVDASVQGPGEATVEYTSPSGGGTVEDGIEILSSASGPYTWTARASGVSPIISVVALEFDLP